MKAIKFLILAAGVLGIISFFLPYATIDRGADSVSFTALDVMTGVDLAEAGVGAAKSKLEAEGAELSNAAELRRNVDEIEEVLDTIKGIVVVIFLPMLVFAVIGVVGAVRGKLERVGGVFVLIFGLIGIAVNGVFLAAWGSAQVKSAGGSAAFAQYLLLFASITGFIGGLLTLIKPDRGGRFG